MKILENNIDGKKVEFILVNKLYVSVTDYGLKKFLVEVSYGPGQSTWYLVPFKLRSPIDINPLHYTPRTFDDIINRNVNDPYVTLYQFDSFEEMIENWKNIKYIDKKITKYKGE